MGKSSWLGNRERRGPCDLAPLGLVFPSSQCVSCNKHVLFISILGNSAPRTRVHIENVVLRSLKLQHLHPKPPTRASRPQTPTSGVPGLRQRGGFTYSNTTQFPQLRAYPCRGIHIDPTQRMSHGTSFQGNCGKERNCYCYIPIYTCPWQSRSYPPAFESFFLEYPGVPRF